MTGCRDIQREQMTSEFIVGTCQLIPMSYDWAFDCMPSTTLRTVYCGSAMEFYIRPLNYPCVSDLDSLDFQADVLAFKTDFPILPRDVSLLGDTIKCFKIEPYVRYPGFVRVRRLGEMKYNWKLKKYEFTHEVIPNLYLMSNNASGVSNIKLNQTNFGVQSQIVRGPAVTLTYGSKGISRDNVSSVWCPQWPREAEEWPRRPRNSGWPTTDKISEVMQHGCHVVYVQHRSCRNDETQWRLSFSAAEVILLQSWTKIQQIVYHLLRIFAKRELIQKDCPKEDEILCPYHLKTVMLWTCEEMSPEWWTSSSVIAIACDLLRKISEWLSRKYCPNYFIPDANLFHLPLSSSRLETVEMQLDEFCNCGILCNWFVENYMLPFIHTFYEQEPPWNQSTNFVNYIKPFHESQLTLKLKSLDYLFSRSVMVCNKYSRSLLKFETNLGPRSCLSYIRLIRKNELVGLGETATTLLPIPENVFCFTIFDTALCSLNAAYGLVNGKMACDSNVFVDYIKGFCWKPKSVRCEFHRLPIPLTAEGSQFQFWQAQVLMESLTGLNCPSEFQLLSLLSKGFLKKTLECDDFELKRIAPAALVYLAALHFASSEKYIVIDLCSTVLICQVSHEEDETLNGGCLFFVDDVVRIVGLCLLCKKSTEKEKGFFRRRPIYLDLRLTPKVFAYYLTVKFPGMFSKQLELNNRVPTSAFPLDQLLMAVTITRSVICFKHDRLCVCLYSRTKSLTANVLSIIVNPLLTTEKLIGFLMKYALKNIASFYDVIRKDYGVPCNATDCYRALHLYKCRQYDEALHLCQLILTEPDLYSDFQDLALFANVLVVPSLHLFFDGDVQSLLGFRSLFWCLSPLVKDDAVFKSQFSHLLDICRVCTEKQMPQLRYWILLPYSIKYHFSIGRHFLAKYLKLRWCVDCSHPCTQPLAEFAAMKCNLPFEKLIRQIVLQGLCKDTKS